ncbi:hypothetical protein ACSL103130_09365 [Actinomyces slackii]
MLIALVLFPLAWFLTREGATALTGGEPATWPSSLSLRGLAMLAGGAAVFSLAVLAAVRSTLGAIVVGSIGVLLGLPFVVAPGALADLLGPTMERLNAHSDLGASLATHIMADGLSGRFVLMGLFMILLGVVTHGARKAGRREQAALDRFRRDQG